VKNNCIGLVDLLSSYADGELTEENKKLVEDHLAICENCSAILKIYREIPGSVSDTNVEAPPSLHIGVMNLIQNESVPRETKVIKHRRHLFIALTRYAPIAACLVVMLLVWQFWGDNFRSQNDIAAPAAAPAPDAAPEAVMVEDADEQGIYAEAESFMEPAAAGSADDSGNPAPAAPAPSADAPEDRMLFNQSLTDEETTQITEFISDAYVEIMIIGELPAFLAGIEPKPFGSWSGWEKVYEIPGTDLQRFLDELGSGDDISVMYNDHNSANGYAVVFFSPGR